eukprot:1640577-Rhodomonas_salina.1
MVQPPSPSCAPSESDLSTRTDRTRSSHPRSHRTQCPSFFPQRVPPDQQATTQRVTSLLSS